MIIYLYIYIYIDGLDALARSGSRMSLWMAEIGLILKTIGKQPIFITIYDDMWCNDQYCLKRIFLVFPPHRTLESLSPNMARPVLHV